MEFVIRYIREKFQLVGFRYKHHKQTNYLSAFQLLFSNGYESYVFLARGEDAEDLIQVKLAKDQRLASSIKYSTGENMAVHKYFDEHGSVFAEFNVYDDGQNENESENEIPANPLAFFHACQHHKGYLYQPTMVIFG